MSDQHDDQREQKRRQRERQYEIDRITFQYATAFRSGRNPRIEDYVRRYPQYTGELMEYALYFHTVGFDSVPLEEPEELKLSPAGEKAMAWIREQRVAYAPIDSVDSVDSVDAIEGLVKQGNKLKITPPQLAEAVGLTVSLLGRIETRVIDAASIPRALFQRLATTLKTSPEAIAAYLGVTQTGQAGGFFYADQPPDQKQQSFLDAVQASALSPERKREWADIVQEESHSGP
jgi:hypothetical protein